jgi:hypothetical protein
MLAAAALELAGARVSVLLAEMSGEEEEWGLELIHCVGAPFIAPRRVVTPSCASVRRRWIECLQ